MFLVLFAWLTIHGSRTLSPVDYDPHKGNNLNDNEEPNNIQIPKEKLKFATFVEDAAFLGLLFAGKSEFPWIVDIRVHDAEQEEWSTGNLVSAKNVLTTCRAVKLLQDFGNVPEVIYFTQYVWEFHEFDMDKRNAGKVWPKQLGGRRGIKSYIVHQKCKEHQNERTLSYDIACIVLKDPVDSAMPFIGYMPIDTDPLHPNNIPSIQLKKMETQKIICLVGSVGRDYVNVKNHMVRGFKVRFRVYWEIWQTCLKMMNKLCDDHKYNCRGMFPNADVGRDWMCMRTRARVGTVCDHDRGAPLVCDDRVVGVVVFGALLDYCNDRFPMPFVVSRLTKFSHFILKRVHE